MKTELDENFELKDDPQFHNFHVVAFPVTLLLAYFISIAGAIGIVKFANWFAQTY